MLSQPLCFLDLETTGTSPNNSRIIDVGIIKVLDGKVIQEYEQLINPQVGLDPFIEKYTGIKTSDLENAPTFQDVHREILEILADSILVAHNVRFDYGFLRNELKRLEISFQMRHFCSIKLARSLFPNLRYYNLDTIVSNFGIQVERRHRAYDDAKAIWDFYRIAKSSVSDKLFNRAIDLALKKPSVPIYLKQEELDVLPEKPGVYLFYGEDGFPLYIGKSVNIRDRVLSHFSNDHMSGTDLQISQEIRSIETITTAGELGALLLESTLIKKYQPLYNRMLRYSRKLTILVKKVRDDGYFTVETKEVEKIDLEISEKLLGTFKTRRQMTDFLWKVAKEHKLCPRLLNLEKGRGKCFYYHLGTCMGACDSLELSIKYNVRFEEAFYKHKVKQWKFDGPIMLKETGDTEEGFVIDKWCLLGSVKEDSDLDNISRDYLFDLDTYKILTKFILKPHSSLKISQINTVSL